MKLIIEIPEGEYGTIKQFEKLGKYSDKNDVGQRTLSRIANGIPLEQIRAEIEECLKYAEHNKKVLSDELNKERCIGSVIAFENVLQIIDKYR